MLPLNSMFTSDEKLNCNLKMVKCPTTGRRRFVGSSNVVGVLVLSTRTVFLCFLDSGQHFIEIGRWKHSSIKELIIKLTSVCKSVLITNVYPQLAQPIIHFFARKSIQIAHLGGPFCGCTTVTIARNWTHDFIITRHVPYCCCPLSHT